ncbi:MAG: pentapeptide repeat-containing protein [Rubrivivax sp.]|nr:pentapeptide repeat-containing protein [Rubrivivax sp.]
MADRQVLDRLAQGREAWNRWRRSMRARGVHVAPDLRRADLRGARLAGFDLADAQLAGARLDGAHLAGASLNEAVLRAASLCGADLRRCRARFAIFSRADLAGAKLQDGDFRCASFRRSRLHEANLGRANLRHASFVEAQLDGAILDGAQVYGLGAWSLVGTPASQSRLMIQAAPDALAARPDGPPRITVDDLLAAQLLFVLLDNRNIASLLRTTATRTVLLLGRFTRPRIAALNTLRELLLAHNLVPMVFDFPPAPDRDLTETVVGLAHITSFVIVDLTDAKSVAQELSFIVPNLPSLPVVPLLREGKPLYGMFEHFLRYGWVHDVVAYRSLAHLREIFAPSVLGPALRSVAASRRRRAAPGRA